MKTIFLGTKPQAPEVPQGCAMGGKGLKVISVICHTAEVNMARPTSPWWWHTWRISPKGKGEKWRLTHPRAEEKLLKWESCPACFFVLRGCSYHIYQKMNTQVTVSIGDKEKTAAESSSQGFSLWQFDQTGLWERKWFTRIHSLPSALLGTCCVLEPVCFPWGDYQVFNLPWISSGLCFCVWEVLRD